MFFSFKNPFFCYRILVWILDFSLDFKFFLQKIWIPGTIPHFIANSIQNLCKKKNNLFFFVTEIHFANMNWWKSVGWGGTFGLVIQQKIWKLEPKLVQKVVQTCPLVLKLCEVAVPTSFTTSENFIKKYWFLVKLSMISHFILLKFRCSEG